MTAGLKNLKDSGKEAAGPGVTGAFNNIRGVLGPLETDLRRLVNNSLATVRDTAFDPVDDLIADMTSLISNGSNIVVSANSSLHRTSRAFDDLAQSFSALRSTAGDSGLDIPIPDPSEVPSVATDTEGTLNEAYARLEDVKYQIGNLSENVEEVKAQITDNSSTVGSIYDTISATTNDIVRSVNDFQASYDRENMGQKIDDYYAYVILSNKIRLPVVIILCIVPIILSGLWIIGCVTKKYKLMLVGFWWAAAICWLMLLIAAIHVALFIPMKDVCRQRDPLVRKALNQFVFNDGTNYAASLGVTSPPQAVNAVNTAVSRVLANPSLVLNCKGDESLVTVLNLDVPSLLGLDEKFAEAKDDIRNQTNDLDISRTIAEAEPIFRELRDGIGQVGGNITSYFATLTDYHNQFRDLTNQFSVSIIFNSTTETRARNSLNDINDYIASNSPPYAGQVYTYDDIEDFDSSLVVDNTQRAELEADKQFILAAVTANNTAKNISAELVNWTNAMDEIQAELDAANAIVRSAQNLIDDGWNLLNSSGDLATRVTNAVLDAVDDALDDAKDIARVPDLGKCAFVGNFVRTGINRGVCREVRGSAGGVALCLFLLGLAWLVSWPFILSSKAHFASRLGENEMEMK